jgi:hypothetical protein
MERTNGDTDMSDIDDRMEAQEAEYEMGLMREQEEIERQNEEAYCQGCGKELIRENAWMEDGCPCNSPKGCNRGNQTISDWRNDRIHKLQFDVATLTARAEAAERERAALRAELDSLPLDVRRSTLAPQGATNAE